MSGGQRSHLQLPAMPAPGMPPSVIAFHLTPYARTPKECNLQPCDEEAQSHNHNQSIWLSTMQQLQHHPIISPRSHAPDSALRRQCCIQRSTFPSCHTGTLGDPGYDMAASAFLIPMQPFSTMTDSEEMLIHAFMDDIAIASRYSQSHRKHFLIDGVVLFSQ